ncbi:MAG: PEP-utilizing enzyme [Armatimonadota bacterium]
MRTYGVPAVIGCKGVTGILHDGLRVTLDGSAGTVETGKKVTT